MDILPGNPYIYDYKERELEKKREMRVKKYDQWCSAEKAIINIIDNNNIWDLCDNNLIFTYNHTTDRFIKDNKYNRSRIQNYPDFIDFIYLKFNATTGWYSYENKIHIPDKSIYHLYNSTDNLMIEVSERKRFNCRWEYTKEEKLKKEIKDLNEQIIHMRVLNNMLCDELDIRDEMGIGIKKILNVQLNIFEKISGKILEGDYLELMNSLKKINDKLK